MNKYSVPYITIVRSQCYSRQHIIGLYGTPADHQAMLRLSWYLRLIRLEDSIRKRIRRPIRFEIRFERKKRFAGP